MDSNDILYAAESEYSTQLLTFSSHIFSELLQAIAALGDSPDASDKRTQATLAHQTVELIIGTAVLDADLVTVCERLFSLAAKSGAVEPKVLKATVASLAQRAVAQGKMYKQVHSRLAALAPK